MLDTLIIGGGIHGTSLSLHLTARKGIPRDRLCVLDPYEQPLALWETLTGNVGMEFLRSPHAHNLHYDPFSLITFTRTRRGEPLARFTDPFGRPSLELFRAHNQHLIQRHRLESLRIQGRAHGLLRLSDGWRVETNSGSIEARRVVIAIGLTEQPYWPSWAQPLRAAGAPIHHIFDPQFSRVWSSTARSLPLAMRERGSGGEGGDIHTVVVGGGITAAQAALSLTADGPVTLLMRHPVQVHAFDSDPCWVTSICLADFHRERDYNRRRALLQQARHRGSMPPDVAAQLQQAVIAGVLTRRMGDITNALVAPALVSDKKWAFSPRPEGEGQGVRVSLHLASEIIEADRVVLATGFEPSRPGGAWLDQAIDSFGLLTADCGYPIVDRSLCWAPGLYVTGPLAELEVGPVARNIIGARLAAERIASAL
jgi:hypothetical protein